MRELVFIREYYNPIQPTVKTENNEIPIEIELRDEPWGDRHFAILDPNGIGIDIVTPTWHFSGRGLTDRSKSLWGGRLFNTGVILNIVITPGMHPEKCYELFI